MACATSSFPVPGLAGDEDRQIGRRGLLQPLEDAAHARALPDQRAEAGDVRDVDLARARRRELDHRIAERDVRVLGDVDLADARVADERAVADAEVAHPHAPLGGDELHVHGADLAVVEHQVAGLVAAHDDGVGSDLQLLLGACALGRPRALPPRTSIRPLVAMVESTTSPLPWFVLPRGRRDA